MDSVIAHVNNSLDKKTLSMMSSCIIIFQVTSVTYEHKFGYSPFLIWDIVRETPGAFSDAFMTLPERLIEILCPV